MGQDETRENLFVHQSKLPSDHNSARQGQEKEAGTCAETGMGACEGNLPTQPTGLWYEGNTALLTYLHVEDCQGND